MSRLLHEPLTLPPENILRAYLYLVGEAFVVLRSSRRLGDEQAAYVHDLADAMHNVSDLLAGYGDWLDDAKYRANFLAAFDEKWGGNGPKLEGLLQEFLVELSRTQTLHP